MSAPAWFGLAPPSPMAALSHDAVWDSSQSAYVLLQRRMSSAVMRVVLNLATRSKHAAARRPVKSIVVADSLRRSRVRFASNGEVLVVQNLAYAFAARGLRLY